MLAKDDEDREFWKDVVLAVLPPLISTLPELIKLVMGKNEDSDDESEEEKDTEETKEVKKASFRHFVRARKRITHEQPR